MERSSEFWKKMVVLGLLVLCVGPCSSSTAPERLASIRPELEFLELQSGRMRDGGILFVEMLPIDREFRLPPNEYLEVAVSSQSGELETLRLRPELCGLVQGEAYLCRFFSIRMVEGQDVRQIEGELQQRSARLNLVAAIPSFGSAYAFGDWTKTMAAARGLPNVVNVDYVRFLVASPDVPPLAAFLAGALPFNRGSPIPRDGIVTGLPTDTISITYLQPNSLSLTYRVSPPTG